MMETKRFDAMTRVLALATSRRGAAVGLATIVVGSLTAEKAVAKKRKKKKAVCHDGQTIMVTKKAVKTHLAHGDTSGACAACRQQRQPCAGGACCGSLICEDVPGCNAPSGPYCCGPEGSPCQAGCDCCGILRCSEREGATCRDCAPAQDACEADADCCAAGGSCGDNGCAIGDVCLLGPGADCADGCDCAAELFCSEREGDTCQNCALPQGACAASSDCCLGESTCQDNGCDAEPNAVCCQGPGAYCVDSCDCCADFVCDEELEACVALDEANRSAVSGRATSVKRAGSRPAAKARWARARR